MKKLKENLPTLASITIILMGCITIPVFAFVSAVEPDQNDLKQFVVEQNAETREFVQGLVGGNKIQDVIAELQPLQVIKQKQPVPQPIPDSMMLAFYKQNKELENIRLKYSELAHQVKTMQSQVAKRPVPVDRNGNSPEALQDIYADVNVPELPDPMLKALARNPGSRLLADPDTGEYVPAVTEWRQTSWGGARQLHLLRHKGKVYGQTVLHKSKSQESPPPQQEKAGFNLNLGNN